jgi:hypothetical protein
VRKLESKSAGKLHAAWLASSQTRIFWEEVLGSLKNLHQSEPGACEYPSLYRVLRLVKRCAARIRFAEGLQSSDVPPTSTAGEDDMINMKTVRTVRDVQALAIGLFSRTVPSQRQFFWQVLIASWAFREVAGDNFRFVSQDECRGKEERNAMHRLSRINELIGSLVLLRELEQFENEAIGPFAGDACFTLLECSLFLGMFRDLATRPLEAFVLTAPAGFGSAYDEIRNLVLANFPLCIIPARSMGASMPSTEVLDDDWETQTIALPGASHMLTDQPFNDRLQNSVRLILLCVSRADTGWTLREDVPSSHAREFSCPAARLRGPLTLKLQWRDKVEVFCHPAQPDVIVWGRLVERARFQGEILRISPTSFGSTYPSGYVSIKGLPRVRADLDLDRDGVPFFVSASNVSLQRQVSKGKRVWFGVGLSYSLRRSGKAEDLSF